VYFTGVSNVALLIFRTVQAPFQGYDFVRTHLNVLGELLTLHGILRHPKAVLMDLSGKKNAGVSLA
jgi:hypothetical protein